MSPAIFDREEIVTFLKGSCLGSTGTSAVIIGSQKVGKTHLLDHVYRSLERPGDVIFCRIDVDMLLARLRPGEALSDDTFYRQMLDSLADHIEDWIRREEEANWNEKLLHIERQAAQQVSAGDADTLKALDQATGAYRAKLEQLATLRTLHETMRTLVHQANALRPVNLFRPLKQLSRLQRRVVLIIDEFHRMLGERGLTDNLFSFLRGANTEGNVIAIVASTLSLMDPSLHRDSDPAVDRTAFFNQFQPQPLSPFNADFAARFVEWLASTDGITLTADEVRYIEALGGGSPYFLKRALGLFVQHGRPATEKRSEFERLHVIPVFETGFHDLWRRCDAAEKELLQAIASNEEAEEGPMLDRLERDGYLMRRDGQCKVFCDLFAQFTRAQGDWGGSSVNAIPKIGPTTIPTSLFIQQPDLTEPLVTFDIRNPTRQPARVIVACSIPGFSREAREMVTVPPSKTVTKSLSPGLIRTAITALATPENAEIVCEARLVKGNAEQLLFLTTKPVQLLAKDHFVFARANASGIPQEWTWLITAWLTPRSEALVSVNEHARSICDLHGYPVDTDHLVPSPRAQAEALYQALAALPLHYDNSAVVFHQAKNDFAQRVRHPAESIATRTANCLDGCVLFASLLMRIGLDPIILFLRGHAIVGWKVTKDSDEWEFVDTTFIGRSSFDAAYEVGQRYYQDVRVMIDEWRAAPPVALDLTRLFAIPVDVSQEMAKRRIVPLL